MIKTGYVFLALSLLMICTGVYGWLLHMVTLVGIILSMAGCWWRHRGER